MNRPPLNLRLSWKSLIAIAVSGGAIWLALQGIEIAELTTALKGARGSWLLVAIAMFGVGGLFAATRYHLMLRVTGANVHPGATFRIFYIGHFFNLLLFGPAAGDVARSALYSHWFKVPLPRVIAAAPLDRLLGLGGLTILVGIGFLVGYLSGAFVQLAIDLRALAPWIGGVAAILIVVVATLVFFRPESESVMARTWMAFREGGKELLNSPRRAARGLALGFCVQAAIGATLALCLVSVSSQPVSLFSMIWIFPVISVLTSLPSVAGLGLRENAALALMGLYGIADADAVAASLLFMACNLCWVAFGGLLLWREAGIIQNALHRTGR